MKKLDPSATNATGTSTYPPQLSGLIGLGNNDYRVGLLIGNRPPLDEMEYLSELRPARSNELADIVAATGNHWRKVFTIAAKIGFSLWPGDAKTWQHYRDSQLFQRSGQLSLLFSTISEPQPGQVQLVLGKQYCQSSFPQTEFRSIGEGIAQHPDLPIYQVPYFDYRQLPNRQIEHLVDLLKIVLDER